MVTRRGRNDARLNTIPVYANLSRIGAIRSPNHSIHPSYFCLGDKIVTSSDYLPFSCERQIIKYLQY